MAFGRSTGTAAWNKPPASNRPRPGTTPRRKNEKNCSENAKNSIGLCTNTGSNEAVNPDGRRARTLTTEPSQPSLAAILKHAHEPKIQREKPENPGNRQLPPRAPG